MNQNRFFLSTVFSGVPGRHLRDFVVPLLLCLALLTNASEAQDSNQFESSVAQIQELGFPSEPVVFDPAVQQASHISEISQNQNPGSESPSASDWISMAVGFVQKSWSQSGGQSKWSSVFAGADVGRMLGSLALVIGGYFGLVWIVRSLGGAAPRVPSEVLELLGSVPLSHKKQLKIVRLGSKLLLLIDGDDGTHSIGEISDPNEVEYLSSLCRGKNTQNAGVTRKIRMAAQQLAGQSPEASTPTVSNASNSNSMANTGLNENHLSAILQALNGPRSGNAAVFEG